MYTCVPTGVCAKQIDFDVEDGVVTGVHFTGGCPGNLEAVSRLVAGMPVKQVIETLSGIKCGNKPTSCPDQFARILKSVEDGTLEPAEPAGMALNPFA
jgi:uncharacterized protein (TIGR03905 family)